MLYGRVSRGLGGPFHSNVTIAGEQVSFSFSAIEHAFSGKHCSGKRGDVLAAGFYASNGALARSISIASIKPAINA
jgi:hypothetical protein